MWTSIVLAAGALGALGLGLIQIKNMRRGWQAQNALEMARDLQSDEQRQARRTIYGLKGDGVPYRSWSDSQKHAATVAVQQLNTAAYLAQIDLIPPNMLEDNWGQVFRNVYTAALPRIEDRRSQGETNLWKAFTDLAEDLLKRGPADPFRPSKQLDRNVHESSPTETATHLAESIIRLVSRCVAKTIGDLVRHARDDDFA